ncbi:asparagine synthase-related protein [Embleya scabrispora]|uniref:asparagine synthase-related protein n=1 Tax=Embleya scabrispora TaxID=159449 RepID=UPI00191452CF|nr:ATP-dependent sacrificial sulfur transferase LarE [Embleya scabrispora]
MLPGLSDTDAEAVDRVGALLHTPGRLGVAFSGGVDSSVLLALAVRALGADRVVAVLGVSPSLAADEHTAALRVAATIGARVVEVATREGDLPAYRANGPDRCFHCKDELFSRISAEVVRAHGLTAVAYGENADDVVRVDRPGAEAAVRHRVSRPLADAGLDKAAVRRIAAALGLPCADKPAAPCLASRIPHFSEVTPDKLGQVEAAERGLRGWVSATAGSVTTATSPGSRCPSPRSGRSRASCARRLWRWSGPPGSGWSPSISRACNRAPSHFP